MPNLSEKYRPKRWEDVVGQEHVVTSLRQIIARKEHPPHFLFIGSSGIGKNTIAQIFARNYLGEGWRNFFYEFNASDSRKLTDIRDKIKPLSQVKVTQIINLTEADGMIPLAQEALRRIMEESKNTIFILDCNYESKIIPPIKSRCAEFRFRPLSHDQVIRRLYEICESEGIKTTFSEEEREGFTKLYKICHGDLRKALNELQKIITAKKEINAKTVLEMNKAVNMTYDSIKFALAGDFEKAKNVIEDAYIMSQYSTEVLLDSLVEAVSEIEDDEVKIRIYYELGELDHRLQNTTRPLVPLCSFIAFVYIAPHLKKEVR